MMMMMMMISAESRWGVDPDLRDENEGRRVQLHFGHYVVLPGELVSTVTTCLSVPYADNLCVRSHGNSLSVCIQGIFLLWVPGLGIGVFAALYTAGNILALIRYEPPTSNRVKPDLRGPNPVTHHPRRRAQTAQSFLLQSSTTNHFDSSLVKFSVFMPPQHHVPDWSVQAVKEHVRRGESARHHHDVGENTHPHTHRLRSTSIFHGSSVKKM